MIAAQAIRDRITTCERAIASAKGCAEVIGSLKEPSPTAVMEIQQQLLRLFERRSTLTECLMLVERE